jgi:hypothetical protein
MTDTSNLGLPVIAAAQAQKHVTHNEALRILDTLVQLAVLDRDLNAPPGSPVEGQRWIVKASPAPTGGWAGHGNQIAAWQDGGWQFSVPKTGWVAYVVDEGTLVTWNGTAWGDFFAAVTTIQNLALLGVGTTADATNPFSAKLNNALWVAKTVAEGGDGNLRYKLSKESAAKTLSYLFQDNFSGRAEIGLTGDDDFHVKVSADGSTWRDAITVDRSTGKLTVGQGFGSPPGLRAAIMGAPIEALAPLNLCLNGGMEVSQENGTAAVTLTGTGARQTKYLVDGVMAAYRGTFVAAGQQVADAPAGYRNSLKFTISTAQASLGANDELSILIPVEGLRTARCYFGNTGAAAVAKLFWVKAHRTGSYSGAVTNASRNRSYPFSFTVNAADTWELKSVLVAGDASGSWASDNTVGLYLNICIAGGSSRVGSASAWAGSDLSGVTGTTNGVAATSDAFQITGVFGVALVNGVSVADLPDAGHAPFILRPLDEQIPLCLRYLWMLKPGVNPAAVATGGAFGASEVLFVLQFPVKMRAPPSLTISSVSDFVATDGTGANKTFTGSSLVHASDIAAAIDWTGFGGVMTAGQFSYIKAVSTAA